MDTNNVIQLFKPNKDESEQVDNEYQVELDERIRRVRESLKRINNLMAELRRENLK
jgi:hypothetical protein